MLDIKCWTNKYHGNKYWTLTFLPGKLTRASSEQEIYQHQHTFTPSLHSATDNVQTLRIMARNPPDRVDPLRHSVFQPYTPSQIPAGVPQPNPFSSCQGAFQPGDGANGQRLGAFQPKKPGRWCSMHVHIAWLVYHHKRNLKPDGGHIRVVQTSISSPRSDSPNEQSSSPDLCLSDTANMDPKSREEWGVHIHRETSEEHQGSPHTNPECSSDSYTSWSPELDPLSIDNPEFAPLSTDHGWVSARRKRELETENYVKVKRLKYERENEQDSIEGHPPFEQTIIKSCPAVTHTHSFQAVSLQHVALRTTTIGTATQNFQLSNTGGYQGRTHNIPPNELLTHPGMDGAPYRPVPWLPLGGENLWDMCRVTEIQSGPDLPVRAEPLQVVVGSPQLEPEWFQKPRDSYQSFQQPSTNLYQTYQSFQPSLYPSPALIQEKACLREREQLHMLRKSDYPHILGRHLQPIHSHLTPPSHLQPIPSATMASHCTPSSLPNPSPLIQTYPGLHIAQMSLTQSLQAQTLQTQILQTQTLQTGHLQHLEPSWSLDMLSSTPSRFPGTSLVTGIGRRFHISHLMDSMDYRMDQKFIVF